MSAESSIHQSPAMTPEHGPIENVPDDYSLSLRASGLLIGAWAASSAACIMFTKHLFVQYGYTKPITLTAADMAIAAVIAVVVNAVKARSLGTSPSSKSLYDRIATVTPVALLFAANLALSNVAWRQMSIHAVMGTNALVPLLVVGTAIAFKLDRVNRFSIAAAILLLVGTSLTFCGDWYVTFLGATFQLGAIATRIGYLIAFQYLLQSRGLLPSALVAYFVPVSAAVIALFAISVDETVTISTGSGGSLTAAVVGLIIARGAISYVKYIASAYTIRAHGATVGVLLAEPLANIVIIVISLVIWHQPPQSWISLGINVLAVSIYGVKVFRDGRRPATGPLSI